MEIKRCYPTLVGGSVCWNQLCNSDSVTVQNGHKYYMIKGGTKSIGASSGTAITGLTSGTDIVIDLTALLGSTIADYVYSLEQATAGSGIAWLRSYGFFTESYYPYDAGTIRSVEATGKKVVGFNQWDEEWEVGSINASTGIPTSSTTQIRSVNFCKCIPNTQYCKAAPNTSIVNVFWYDAEKQFISVSGGGGNNPFVVVTSPANAYYFKIRTDNAYGTTYNHDICISLSSDRNGEYEPYTAQSYTFDDLTLRGIPKLSSSNELYYDGDRYEADGTVTRNTIVRAYESGDESLANAITDGTNTVVYSVNASTETADPYTSPQIVYPDGTEEYITANGVPVGHETKYQL